ncbi:RluA family pseudouridine synthase [Paenibacillus daejeonensis]|uniref:RluA family pseudouridine synthase n=1 Tax=Paenibacillus daejeonensis TaxID=135193 RepID=UPI00037E6E5B|nr:RluA family pseudouridine synthase [Paenibacillus daejeonensis]
MSGYQGDAGTDIQVLYEDNHLLVVSKPPGIPSQEDESGDPDMLTLLKADLKERYNKPGNVFLGLVHRLDRPVGGAMLFAKTSKAASRLSDAVRSRSFGKTYAAVLAGVPASTSGSLRHYLLKDKSTNTVRAFDRPVAGAKEALLDYTVVAAGSGCALAAVRLHTGRSHQIRVQMAQLGCPLAGDRKYGGSSGGGNAVVPEIALWSTSISVAHPVTREPLVIRSQPPQNGAWTLWSPEQLTRASEHYLP